MSMHEIVAPQPPQPPQPLAHLREREEQAEFLSNASNLLMRTSRLVASELDAEGTLDSIARLVLPHAGVWSVLEIREGIATRRIGAADQLVRPRPGSVLTVALSADTETLGSLTFIAPVGGHVFDDRDRQLAKDVGAGASIAIVNSRHAATRAHSRETARRGSADRLAFISALSHGLRTPLHAIHGYAQLLDQEVRGPLNDRQRGDVRPIQANERHLLNLASSVIGYARWEDDEPLALEDISVRIAIQLTNAIIVRAATQNGVLYDPENDAIDESLTVRAEPRRLREILLQLMLNAVRFSRPQDSVGVHAVKVGNQVWIRVTDTGVGISREHLDAIFQPFRQAGDSLSTIENGVGLGLAITQRLARAMGGELSAVSAIGRGSTFTLALPCGRSEDEG
jgi:signal transduction histidine kinase